MQSLYNVMIQKLLVLRARKRLWIAPGQEKLCAVTYIAAWPKSQPRARPLKSPDRYVKSLSPDRCIQCSKNIFGDICFSISCIIYMFMHRMDVSNLDSTLGPVMARCRQAVSNRFILDQYLYRHIASQGVMWSLFQKVDMINDTKP